MKKNLTRTLSLFLAVVLIFSLVPTWLGTRAEAAETKVSMTNASFENSLYGWTTVVNSASGNTITASSTRASAGSYSALLNDISTGHNAVLRSDKIAATGDAMYKVTADFYAEADAPCYISLECLDEDGNAIHSASTPTIYINKWHTVTAQLLAPSATTHLRVQIFSTTSGICRTYADNLALTTFDAPADSWTIEETAHPRLFFTADEVSAIQARSTNNTLTDFGYVQKDVYAGIQTAADDYLDDTTVQHQYYGGYVVTFNVAEMPTLYMQSPPGYNGSNYPYWGNYCKGLRDRLQALALAYVVTGNTAYSNKAIELTMKIADWTYWSQPADEATAGTTVGLDTVYLVTGVSTVYDMCYDQLTEAQKAAIPQAMIDKALDLMYISSFNHIDNNIPLASVAALGLGACAIADPADAARTELVNKYLTSAYDYYEWYLDSRMTSGAQEGYSYTAFALDTLMVGVDAIARVTGKTDLLTHEYFTSGVFTDWFLNCVAPESYTLPAYSDSPETPCAFITMNLVNRDLATVAPEAAKAAGYYLKVSKPESTGFQKFIYTCDNPIIDDPSDITYVSEYLGYGAMRTGWFGSSDMVLTMVSNTSTMNHNHYDQNAIQLAFDGTWLASDPGYADLSPGSALNQYMTWDGHTVIYVDGEAQSLKGTGSLQEVLATDTYSHMVGSAADAYGVGVLTQNDRHAILVNHTPNPYYVVIDELNSAAKHSYGWNLAACNWDSLTVDGVAVTTGTNLAGKTMALAKGDKNLFVNFVGVAAKTAAVGEYENTGYQTMTATATNRDKFQFMTVLNASNATTPNVTATTFCDNETALAATVNAGSIQDMVLYNRSGSGTSVSAGRVTTDAKIATYMNVTDTAITEGFGAQAVTNLSYNSVPYFQSSSAVDVSASFVGNYKTYTITSDEAQSVTLYAVGNMTSFTINGVASTAYTVDGDYVTVSIPAGTTTLFLNQKTIPVTKMYFTGETMELQLGDSTAIKYTLLPLIASNKTIIWSSSEADIAKVDETGLVTAVGVGTAVITGTTADGGFTDTMTVTISSANVSSIITMIDEIGAVDLTKAADVQLVLTAYNALSATEKAAVTNRTTLFDAEDALVGQMFYLAGVMLRTEKASGFESATLAQWSPETIRLAWEKAEANNSAADFVPSRNLSVAKTLQLASLLHQMYTTGSAKETVNTFKWYSPYVSYAVRNGIASWNYVNASRYIMNKPASRTEFVSFFANAIPDVIYGA